MRRRLLTLVLLLAVAGLGLLLYGNVRESRLFRISAPLQPTPSVQKSFNGTTQVSLTTVSTTTLLESPRYTGQDAKGRSWEITAKTAGQQGSSTSATLILMDVQAALELPAGKTGDPSQTITLTANEGSYGQAAQQLHLSGMVQVTGQGLTLTSPEMQAEIETRQLTATGGAEVKGRIGPWQMDITAPKLEADAETNHLKLTGGVRAVLTPDKSPRPGI